MPEHTSGGRFTDERAAFEAKRGELIRDGHSKKWVVVKGAVVLGPFVLPDDAWRAGIQAWGPGFMLKRVLPVDKPIVVSHISLHDPRT
jgi:hypothetical protein